VKIVVSGNCYGIINLLFIDIIATSLCLMPSSEELFKFETSREAWEWERLVTVTFLYIAHLVDFAHW